MGKQHHYLLNIQWTGNKGEGTIHSKAYERSHSIQAKGKEQLHGSSDPAFRGDPGKYNPEDLLVASISVCHMLWFLHICSDNGVVVHTYTDNPAGIMEESADGGGRFTNVTLNPVISITKEIDFEDLQRLHNIANKKCFISQSVNFPIDVKPLFSIHDQN